MSNDDATGIPPIPDRSAAEAARAPVPGAPLPPHQAPRPHQPAAYGPPAPVSPQPQQAGPHPAPGAQAHPAWQQPQPQKRTSGGSGGKVAALVLAAALVGGGVGFGGAWLGLNAFSNGSETPAATSEGGRLTINNPDEVNQTAAIAAASLPSVVTLEVAAQGGQGSGSGIVLSEDGYVLTNTHVVTLGGAASDAQIRVTTADGSLHTATIVGTDPTYDLAVIKLDDVSGLTPMEFADSSELNVGDTTVAIGSPMGLNNTVTTGVISNLNRSIEIASAAAPEGDQAESEGEELPWYFDFPGQEQQPQQGSQSISIAVLQTDAAINPGNSGGALVDDEGKLIGVNVAIATASASSEEGGSIGLGFAIPSNVAERIANELIENGAATHGLLGASVVPASAVEGTTTTGAHIQELSSGGAADAGGLQEGDVVTEFNGVRINDAVDLTAQVRAAAAGSEATLRYVRDGEEHEATVTLGELE